METIVLIVIVSLVIVLLTHQLWSRCRSLAPNRLDVASALLLKYSQQRSLEISGFVSKLNVYPVKSCSALSDVNQTVVTETGFYLDREWMIVQIDYGLKHLGTGLPSRFVTQRNHPLLATIEVSINDEYLILNAHKMSALEIPLKASRLQSNPVGFTLIWGKPVDVEYMGEESSSWLSTYLGFQCQLVRLRDGYRRLTDSKFNDAFSSIIPSDMFSASFSDGFPILLTTEDSLFELNARLSLKSDSIEMERFRPNIVVTSMPFTSKKMGFLEDYWRVIRIGKVIFFNVKPCSRCVMTTRAPPKRHQDGFLYIVDDTVSSTNEKLKEPLKTLFSFRTKNDLNNRLLSAVYRKLGRTFDNNKTDQDDIIQSLRRDWPCLLGKWATSANVFFGINLTHVYDRDSSPVIKVGDRVEILEYWGDPDNKQ